MEVVEVGFGTSGTAPGRGGGRTSRRKRRRGGMVKIAREGAAVAGTGGPARLPAPCNGWKRTAGERSMEALLAVTGLRATGRRRGRCREWDPAALLEAGSVRRLSLPA